MQYLELHGMGCISQIPSTYQTRTLTRRSHQGNLDPFGSVGHQYRFNPSILAFETTRQKWNTGGFPDHYILETGHLPQIPRELAVVRRFKPCAATTLIKWFFWGSDRHPFKDPSLHRRWPTGWNINSPPFGAFHNGGNIYFQHNTMLCQLWASVALEDFSPSIWNQYIQNFLKDDSNALADLNMDEPFHFLRIAWFAFHHPGR